MPESFKAILVSRDADKKQAVTVEELTEADLMDGDVTVAVEVDTVGSTTLANVLSMTAYGGAVAACGLAGGMNLPATVAPFILRGVSLLGVDSVMAPKKIRLEAWRRIGADLDPAKLAALSTTIGFDGIVEAAHAIVDGKVRGRIVVDM